MAGMKAPVATDSAAELRDLIGEDATATFESDPKFIDSDVSGGASSENVEVQRDTDDVEEDEEEDEEDDLDDVEDDDELEDDDEFADDDEDEDDEDEDGEEEGIATAGLTSVRGSLGGGGAAVEDAEEEDDDVGDVEQGMDEEEDDEMDTDRVVDSALRMMALVAVAAEFAQFAAGRKTAF